ncbi:hypothetical protein QQS21_003849 [Conoideocrella luteorostrata]|uniref:Uncharacterized protein n=1 Tax=Conoideocrella luteorostrata TaxID=1105319 RepID=A0AAJ0CSR5_9HYPO|nr:hypothetical protein QQS21_003849 [Conoideocrella luteorostrata]
MTVCVDEVVRDAKRRDSYRDKHKAMCIGMEDAGILGRKNCLVIRGISDYADSHKSDTWQGYAAAAAAAILREILYTMGGGQIQSMGPLTCHDAQRLVDKAARARKTAKCDADIHYSLSKLSEAIRQLQDLDPEDVLLATARFGVVECYIDRVDMTHNPDKKLELIKSGEAELYKARQLIEDADFAHLKQRIKICDAVLASQGACINEHLNAGPSAALYSKQKARDKLNECLLEISQDSEPNMAYVKIMKKYKVMLG